MTVNGIQWLLMAVHSFHMNYHLFYKKTKKCSISACSEHIPLLYQFFPSTSIEIQKKNKNIWLATRDSTCFLYANDVSRHQQTCPNMESTDVSMQCGSSVKLSIFKYFPVFYKNWNFFKESDWSIKFMNFQVISSGQI